MSDHLITSDPGGRPVIAGTHVSVEDMLKELAASQAVDVILTAHPELDRDAVQAALAYAAEAVHNTASAPPVAACCGGRALCPTDGVWKGIIGTQKKRPGRTPRAQRAAA